MPEKTNKLTLTESMKRFKRNYVPSFDDTLIYYESWDDGEPLIFCNGVGCDNYIWSKTFKFFRGKYRIITWDYRGHGYSQTPRNFNAVSPADCARDLRHILDDAGIEKGIFLGHSMGSQVIFEFYNLFPERVKGLIPVCGNYGKAIDSFGVPIFKSNFNGILSAVRKWRFLINPVWRRILPSEFSFKVAKLAAINGHLIDRDAFIVYFDHLAMVDVRLFFEMAYQLNLHNSLDYLEKIQAPTLILAGERDNFVPLMYALLMYRKIPNAEICVFPRGTHAAPLELPDLMNYRIEKFLLQHLERAK